MFLRQVFASVAVLCLVGTAVADVPQLLNYQGTLKSGANPVTTPVDVIFAIWNAETDGDSLWSEEHTITPDANGAFSTLLGTISPVPDSAFAGTAYLGVKAGSDPEMSPRNRLVSVGYAYRVGTIDGATGGALDGSLIIPDPEGDTLILDPGDMIIRGQGGDTEVMVSSTGISYTGSGDAMTVTDANGDVRISISIDEDGPAITLFESVTTMDKGGQGIGNPKLEFREGGVTVYGSTASDTVCQMLPSGDIYGKGQFAMGDVHGTSGDWANVVGYSNEASGDSSVVCGGYNNTASGRVSAIVGGYQNIASGPHSFVGGGWNNTASGTRSAIVGGDRNTISDERSFIGGGNLNTITGIENTIAGGLNNTSGPGGSVTIGGGKYNNAVASWSTIGGGERNETDGLWATIAGGYRDTANSTCATIGGGEHNIVDADYGTIPGGKHCEIGIGADVALAAGTQAIASHRGAFVWADNNNFNFASTAFNEFSARCVGGARFVTGIDGSGNPTAGVQVAAGGGSWSSLSDRNLKENFSEVDVTDVLTKVVAIPLSTWNYKAQDESIRHIGPMAQDIYAAFGVGEDERRIATIDADGLALAAIQGLYQQNRELKKENEAIRTQVAELQALMQQLLKERQ